MGGRLLGLTELELQNTPESTHLATLVLNIRRNPTTYHIIRNYLIISNNEIMKGKLALLAMVYCRMGVDNKCQQRVPTKLLCDYSKKPKMFVFRSKLNQQEHCK